MNETLPGGASAGRATTAVADRDELRTELLGCRFDRVAMAEAVTRVLTWCRDERRPHTVITVNAALLVAMGKDASLAQACRGADLVVPDGVPVVWASRIAGASLPARVAGVDLMARLLESASEHRLRVFLLGAREEVVRALADQCKARHPGLVIAGYRNGYFEPSTEGEVIEQIHRSGAQILFVGMPSPFKEVWCERHRNEIGVPAIIGVGGSFDVLAGFIPRAPRWMQERGLEWLWRLRMEPRRLWRRYLLANSVFAARTLVEAVRRRWTLGVRRLQLRKRFDPHAAD